MHANPTIEVVLSAKHNNGRVPNALHRHAKDRTVDVRAPAHRKCRTERRKLRTFFSFRTSKRLLKDSKKKKRKDYLSLKPIKPV